MRIFGVIVCCVAASVALGQSSQELDRLPMVNSPQRFSDPPSVITSQADMEFWTALVTQGGCTSAQLAASLTKPNARKACDTADISCHNRVGVAVLRACMTGPTMTNQCEAAAGPIGTPEFNECIAQQINYDTSPVFFDLSSEQVAVVDDALTRLKAQMPTEVDVRAMTGKTLPERNTILDAISQFDSPSTSGCENLFADQRNFCMLQHIARTTEVRLGAASYIFGKMNE